MPDGERYAPDAGYTFTPHKKRTKEPAADVRGPATNAEFILKNWVECMRDRSRTAANEVEGHYSAAACYMANQALRTRTRVVWDKAWSV